MVICEWIFLDVSVTISRATSTLVYEWPRRGAVFTLVFEIWCARMEVSARKNHKTYAFALLEWSCPLPISKLPCLHGMMQDWGLRIGLQLLELYFTLLNQLNSILQWTQVPWHEVGLLNTILFHLKVEVVGLVRKLCKVLYSQTFFQVILMRKCHMSYTMRKITSNP
jgi:hypothetical protein